MSARSVYSGRYLQTVFKTQQILNRMRGKPPIARPWRSLSQLERRVDRIAGDLGGYIRPRPQADVAAPSAQMDHLLHLLLFRGLCYIHNA